MYYGVSKLQIELEVLTGDEGKILASLADRLRSRFKVSVRTEYGKTADQFATIAVATFGRSESEIVSQFDEIVALCEASGFGRVVDEACIVEHLDNLVELDESATEED